MSNRRREKELKRKRKNEAKAAVPSGAPAGPVVTPRDVIAREVGDPQRLVLHLRRLSELLASVEELRAARIPPQAIVGALVALDAPAIAALPEEKRPAALREKLLPELATEAVAKNARAAFEATLARARSDQDRIPLFAGHMFIDLWLRTKEAPHQNPVWEAIFSLSVLDTLFEGYLLTKLARDSFHPDEAQAAKSFVKALSRSEVAKELESLGMGEPDPKAFGAEYARVARESEKTYLLGFDSLLHLVRANAEFSVAHVKTILAEGVTQAVREAAVAQFEEAYANDLTQPLAEDLAGELVRRLQALAKGGTDEEQKTQKPETIEDEKRVALTALAALRAIPLATNVFLKGTYLGSFDVYKNVAPVEEVPFIRRVWAEPTDRWALEEYEKFLLERRHAHRASRVRRFLAEVRREAQEKESAKQP